MYHMNEHEQSVFVWLNNKKKHFFLSFFFAREVFNKLLSDAKMSRGEKQFPRIFVRHTEPQSNQQHINVRDLNHWLHNHASVLLLSQSVLFSCYVLFIPLGTTLYNTKGKHRKEQNIKKLDLDQQCWCEKHYNHIISSIAFAIDPHGVYLSLFLTVQYHKQKLKCFFSLALVLLHFMCVTLDDECLMCM